MVKLFNLGEADVHLRALLALALGQQLGQAVQGLRAKHHIYIRCPLDDLGAFLAGHAAAHANQHALGFEVLHPAQVAEDFFLRLLAHRAGVEQNQIGLVHVLRGLITLGRAEHIGHLVRVVLVHLAAKCFDEDLLAHAASTEVTEVMKSKQSKARPRRTKVQRFMV